MKKSNLKKLSREQQKQINGSGKIVKCTADSQCGPFQCCSFGVCIYSDIPICTLLE
ncbi:bacteriocin-like protein [Chryseobacterium sp. FH2]|uniref:bacteriocin-like protein n=1 Tax=Chryseobacterium sp. FH2 TaxID=1674291 RepID=UPI000AD7EA3F